VDVSAINSFNLFNPINHICYPHPATGTPQGIRTRPCNRTRPRPRLFSLFDCKQQGSPPWLPAESRHGGRRYFFDYEDENDDGDDYNNPVTPIPNIATRTP